MGGDQLAQAFIQNVGVDFGGGDVSVAQKRLDHSEVSAVGQEVGRKRVAQRVRCDFGRGDTGSDGQVFDQHVETVPGEMAGSAARGKEKT